MLFRRDKLLSRESKRPEVSKQVGHITPDDDQSGSRHGGCADVAVLVSHCSQPGDLTPCS
jgi:hypothetical protein